MSNGLDPDQSQRSASPDLGPSCLKILSADNKKSTLVRQELKHCPTMVKRKYINPLRAITQQTLPAFVVC